MIMRPGEIAESFHLAFLQALATRASLTAWALKGGGTLRFFYGSERFSEGVDLDTFDIEPWVFQDRVDQTLGSDLLKRTLGILGSRVDYADPEEGSGAAGLRAAITRVFEFGYDEYRAKVLSFIEPDTLPLYESIEVWEGMQ